MLFNQELILLISIRFWVGLAVYVGFAGLLPVGPDMGHYGQRPCVGHLGFFDS